MAFKFIELQKGSNAIRTIGTYSFFELSEVQDATPSLVYTLSDDGNYYIVGTGYTSIEGIVADSTRGTAGSGLDSTWTGGELRIPSTYNNKPVLAIAPSAFCDITNITTCHISNGITTIGGHAFEGCSGLTSVILPNSLESIGNMGFANCSGLTSVTIPNSLESIGFCAFEGCSGLTSVTIPNSVTYFGGSGFQDCSGLTSVTIESGVTLIGINAFWGCSRLTSVNYLGTIEQWCNINFGNEFANPMCYAEHLYINNEELFNLKIPNTVTEIKTWAFYGCSRLISVTIPDSITRIHNYAFSGCNRVANIFIYAITPPQIYSDTLTGVPDICLIYVPAESVNAYKAATNWSVRADYICPMPS